MAKKTSEQTLKKKLLKKLIKLKQSCLIRNFIFSVIANKLIKFLKEAIYHFLMIYF